MKRLIRYTFGGTLMTAMLLCAGCKHSEASIYESHLAASIPRNRTIDAAPLPPSALASTGTADTTVR